MSEEKRTESSETCSSLRIGSSTLARRRTDVPLLRNVVPADDQSLCLASGKERQLVSLWPEQPKIYICLLQMQLTKLQFGPCMCVYECVSVCVCDYRANLGLTKASY